jgi:predicted dehydrogenase
MHDNQIVRWGILGAGKIARAFVKDFPFMENATLAAIASSDINRAKFFAEEFNIPLALDYNELYQSNEVDAVYIATTHNFHFEHSMECIRKGKAVLCEKPITVNNKEFELLAAAAKEQQVFLMEAMWTYFLPPILKARQWINEGRIGKLKVIQADFSFAVEKDPEGRMYNPRLAGGGLLDIGIYPIAMAAYFMNRKPDSIKASGALTETGVDERLGILLEYGDVTATLFCSIVTRMSNKLRLFGEKGSIEVPAFWKAESAKLFDAEENLVEHFEDHRTSRGFIFEMQEATDKIRAGDLESDVVPLSRSRELQEIMMEVRNQIGLHYPMDNR